MAFAEILDFPHRVKSVDSKLAPKLSQSITYTVLVMTEKVRSVIGCCYSILNLADTLTEGVVTFAIDFQNIGWP